MQSRAKYGVPVYTCDGSMERETVEALDSRSRPRKTRGGEGNRLLYDSTIDFADSAYGSPMMGSTLSYGRKSREPSWFLNGLSSYMQRYFADACFDATCSSSFDCRMKDRRVSGDVVK